eukprot:2855499-Amphidinium_carterae.1
MGALCPITSDGWCQQPEQPRAQGSFPSTRPSLPSRQLNVKNLSCLEYINRRRMLLEEAHREDASP